MPGKVFVVVGAGPGISNGAAKSFGVKDIRLRSSRDVWKH